jgi:hypothetical protein
VIVVRLEGVTRDDVNFYAQEFFKVLKQADMIRGTVLEVHQIGSDSSRNGPASATVTSWPTGNGPGGVSRCSPSRRCPGIEDVGENYLPVVVGAAVVGDRMLWLLFSDGTVGDVDFSSERWTGVLEPLNDPAYFAKAAVDPEAGTVVWPGGIDLAPEPLYEQAKAHPLAAAWPLVRYGPRVGNRLSPGHLPLPSRSK